MVIHNSNHAQKISHINHKQGILLAEMLAIADRCAALPDRDTRPEWEILGYT